MHRSWPGRTRPSERSCGSSFSENHRTSDASGPVSATPPTMSQTQNSLQQDEDTRWMSLPRSVPRRGKLAHLPPVTAFLLRFLDDVFGRSEVHVCPTTGHRPAVATGNLPHHQQAAVCVEDRAAHVDLRRRVALLRREQRLDPVERLRRVRGHDPGCERTQRLAVFAVASIGLESEPCPGDRLEFPRPGQPVRIGPGGPAPCWLSFSDQGHSAATGRAVVAGPLYPDREVLTFPSGRPRRARPVRGEA